MVMRYVALAVFSLSLAACDAPGPGAEADKADPKAATADKGGAEKADKADDKAEEGSESKDTKIEQVGLTATLPAMSQVSDAIGGKGAMVLGTAPVTITEAEADDPKDVKAAKEEADMYNPKNFKEEKLADGWVVTFENEGSMGTNFWMKSRREIGGKAYICDTSVSKDEQRAAAIEICKSLKK
jgi:hypothetical protein